MEFISSEEFLKQPKEVQEVFIEWWKPQPLDLYVFDKRSSEIVKVSDELFILPYKSNNVWDEKKHCIPLFTEGQLRKFIEDKTKYHLDAMYYVDSYDIRITEGLNNIKVYENLGMNLLQAYWKVACEIAEESV